MVDQSFRLGDHGRYAAVSIMELQINNYRLTLKQAPPHSINSADNMNSYDRVHILGDNAYLTNNYTVSCVGGDNILRTCLVQSCGGVSAVHEHSALTHDGRCFIAIGPYIIGIDIPSFDLVWTTRADDATCFGIHFSQEHNCLISHGELMIARATLDGTLVWRTCGEDIFTNDCQLDGDVIRVTDFNNRKYSFDINNGREISA